MVEVVEEGGGECIIDFRTSKWFTGIGERSKIPIKLVRLLRWSRRPRTWINRAVILVSVLNVVLCESSFGTNEGVDHYSRQWAVHIEGGKAAADRIAEKYDFVNLGKIFDDLYHFEHKRLEKRSLTPHLEFHKNLIREDQVIWAKQQRIKRRAKRDLVLKHRPKLSNLRFNDVEWPQMWYLNRGQGLDMNVQGAWSEGISGKGVVVTILDDGLEKTHPDLEANYDPQASYDVNNHDEDPMPKYDPSDSNRHGTRCAGEVAAVANNSLCSVGVAFGANVGGVRMLDGDVTDAVEARSLSLNPQHIDIYSASWGPDDDGKTVDGPGELATRAFIEGVTKGRQGKGSIFVWASGNGGREHDNCNCDGYTNSIWTLSISSATENGLVPWYSEACSSTLATTYSSGAPGEKQIVTTDLRHKCTKGHTGTSASAPLAAGICALALEANRNLTWRDMQHIVVRTAKPANLKSPDWKVNGVGRNVSHSFGYGLMDATAMVKLARSWKSVPEQHRCEVSAPHVDKLIPPRSKVILNLNVTECAGVNFLEHVQAKISLSSSRRGDLQIYLTSPAGTRSTLLARRPQDSSRNPFNAWPFMSVHTWGEMPFGTWQLEIHNEGRYLGRANLQEWSLLFYGTLQVPNEASGENFLLPITSSDKSKETPFKPKFDNKNSLLSSNFSNKKNGKNWKGKSSGSRIGKLSNATKVIPTESPKSTKTTQRFWHSGRPKDGGRSKGFSKITSAPLPPKHSLPLAIVLGPSGNFTTRHKVPDVFQKYSKVQQLFPLYVNAARIYSEEILFSPKTGFASSNVPEHSFRPMDISTLGGQKAERQNRFDNLSLPRAGIERKFVPNKTHSSRIHQHPGHFEGWQMLFYGTEDTPNGEVPEHGKTAGGTKGKNGFVSKVGIEDDVPNYLEPENSRRGWKDEATRRDDVTRTTTDPLAGPSSGCATLSASAQCIGRGSTAYVREPKTGELRGIAPRPGVCHCKSSTPSAAPPPGVGNHIHFRPVRLLFGGCVRGLHLYGGRCEAICPPGTYPGTNVQKKAACMPCHYTCLTCAGQSEGQCTSCHDDAVAAPSGESEASEEENDEKTKSEDASGGPDEVEDFSEESVRLSWGKRASDRLVTKKPALTKKAVTKKILESYDSPRVLYFCYPGRVASQMQAFYWYRRTSALFSVNLIILIGLLLYFAWNKFASRKKSRHDIQNLRLRYRENSSCKSSNREGFLWVSSSSETDD